VYINLIVIKLGKLRLTENLNILLLYKMTPLIMNISLEYNEEFFYVRNCTERALAVIIFTCWVISYLLCAVLCGGVCSVLDFWLAVYWFESASDGVVKEAINNISSLYNSCRFLQTMCVSSCLPANSQYFTLNSGDINGMYVSLTGHSTRSFHGSLK
jgi:hypothetical protein